MAWFEANGALGFSATGREGSEINKTCDLLSSDTIQLRTVPHVRILGSVDEC